MGDFFFPEVEGWDEMEKNLEEADWDLWPL